MADDNDRKNKQIVTPEARLSFPNLFKARKINPENPDETAKFSATLLFDKQAQESRAFKRMEKMVEEAIRAKWNERPRKLKLPWLTIDDLEKVPDGYTEDIVFIRINTTVRPGVVDRHNEDIIDDSEIYPGCYVRAAIHAYAWEHRQGGKGVSFGLDHVQKTRDGEPFGNVTKPQDVFEELDEDEDSSLTE